MNWGLMGLISDKYGGGPMSQKHQTPHCHACGRIESTLGWRAMEKEISAKELYETLCKDCLSAWTDFLLLEVCGQKNNKRIA